MDYRKTSLASPYFGMCVFNIYFDGSGCLLESTQSDGFPQSVWCNLGGDGALKSYTLQCVDDDGDGDDDDDDGSSSSSKTQHGKFNGQQQLHAKQHYVKNEDISRVTLLCLWMRLVYAFHPSGIGRYVECGCNGCVAPCGRRE